MSAPSVSILLVVKNERANLDENLGLILGQEYEGAVEIIAVDSGSDDGTPELLEAAGARVFRIAPREFHHGRTRNLAASHARHEILVLLSGDARPADAHWLAKLVAPFNAPKTGAVYGRQIPPAHIGPVRRRYIESEYPAIREHRDPESAGRLHPGLFRFSNANAAVRADCWREHPWSEAVLLAEDQGLCRDLFLAGHRIVYEPEAAVIHGHERTLRGEFRFAFDNGLSLTRLGILGNPDIQGAFRYGLRRMRQDLGYFLRRGALRHAAWALAIFFIKWAGVQFGKRGDRLPEALRNFCSEVYRKR